MKLCYITEMSLAIWNPRDVSESKRIALARALPTAACLAMFLLAPTALIAGDAPPETAIDVRWPKDYQVFQMQDRALGRIRIAGTAVPDTGEVQFRLIGRPLAGELDPDWRSIAADPRTRAFDTFVSAPAGGWYRLELRVVRDGKPGAHAAVEHVGVGEVFVIAGQSNSTNYGSEKQKTKSGFVSTFDGSTWRLADDPQPGVQDHSKGGSFIPAFGDALCEKVHVPIGIASVGFGGTSVRQWLMKDEPIDVHPTTDGFVKTIAPGKWVCTGELFDGLMRRIEELGPHGFRAVLWHQGESDAGQAREGYPAERQITGQQHTTLLEKIIRESRKRAGWDFPWFVAQATYHSEKDPSDPEFRAAQKAVCDDGFAIPGPDTDVLRADYRKGVHFNARGLSEHGRLWAKCVGRYLESTLATPPE